jgi:single-strand DNA-binding protein
MASFNKILLMGNLTRDPQMKYLPSQTAVCEIGIAANRKFRTQDGQDREEVLFVDCTAFGRQAEVINQYCSKGKPIFIEGRLKLETWEDKQGGGRRSKHTVVIDNFQFIGGRDDAGGGGGSGGGGGGGYSRGNSDDGGGGGGYSRRDNSSSPPPRRGNDRPPPQKQPADEPFDEGEQFGEDDIPF